MPTDFGDIVDYHRQEVAHYLALAQAARERGDYGEATYSAGQAERYLEAARQQLVGMRQTPGQSSARQGHRRGIWKPQPVPSRAARFMAAMRSAVHKAISARQFIFKRSASFYGLKLH